MGRRKQGETNMKVYELQDYLKGQLRMAEVKIQIGEEMYLITDIKWAGLESVGEVIMKAENKTNL